MGELDVTPISNNCGAQIVPELFLNIGVAVGDIRNKFWDFFAEIVGVLHGKHQGIQPFREIVVKLGALVQHTGTQQLHNNGFANHQVAGGGAFTRRLDIKTGLFNLGDHRVGDPKCQRLIYGGQHRKTIWAEGCQRIFHKIQTAHKIGAQAILLRLTGVAFEKMGIFGTNQTAVTPLHYIGIAVNVMNHRTTENNSDFIVIMGVHSRVGIVSDVEANIGIYPGGCWIILNHGIKLL